MAVDVSLARQQNHPPKKKDTNHELRGSGIVHLMKDETNSSLTVFETPWQLHVPREDRSPTHQRTCELQRATGRSRYPNGRLDDSRYQDTKEPCRVELQRGSGASSFVRSQKRSRHKILCAFADLINRY